MQNLRACTRSSSLGCQDFRAGHVMATMQSCLMMSALDIMKQHSDTATKLVPPTMPQRHARRTVRMRASLLTLYTRHLAKRAQPWRRAVVRGAHGPCSARCPCAHTNRHSQIDAAALSACGRNPCLECIFIMASHDYHRTANKLVAVQSRGQVQVRHKPSPRGCKAGVS